MTPEGGYTGSKPAPADDDSTYDSDANEGMPVPAQPEPFAPDNRTFFTSPGHMELPPQNYYKRHEVGGWPQPEPFMGQARDFSRGDATPPAIDIVGYSGGGAGSAGAKQTWWRRSWVRYAAVALAAAGIGFGAGGGEPEVRTVAGPERVVTREVPGPERVERVEVTPKICLVALDRSDRGFLAAGEGFRLTGEVLQAIQDGDLAGLEQGVKELQANSKKLDTIAPEYNDAKTKCRDLND